MRDARLKRSSWCTNPTRHAAASVTCIASSIASFPSWRLGRPARHLLDELATLRGLFPVDDSFGNCNGDWYESCFVEIIRKQESITKCGRPNNHTNLARRITMLSWALTFFVLAIIAAVFGFGGIAAGAASIAKILFILFLVLFIVSMIANAVRGRSVA